MRPVRAAAGRCAGVQDDLVVDRSLGSSGAYCLGLADGADATFARLWIVDTLTSAERAIAARRLAAARPVVAALAGIAAPEAFWELCRDELSGVDVAAGGWDIRARWFGVVICATPRLGELGRGITIPWRVIAALITAQQPRDC